MKRKVRISLTILLCNIYAIIYVKSFGQNIQDLCNSDIVHYTKQDYNGYYQNWDLVQSPSSKFIYAANSKGLLEYDGSSWKLYQYAQNQKIRSVAVDKSGDIYTGSLGEFGVWKKNHLGELTYQSLKQKINDPYFVNEEIWNIVPTSKGIIFQSFAYIFLYQNDKIKKLKAPGNILFVYEVRNRLFIEVLEKGLYEIKGENFEKIEGSDFLGKESIHTILPIHQNGLLIGTSKGLFIFENNQFKEFNRTTNQIFLQEQLNNGLQLTEDTYVFGTILNGIIITNAEGEILQHFNQKNGLQNNTVLSLAKDVEGNLWVGMDKGIDLILLNSNLKYFTDYDGKLGTVYDIALFQKRLYVGTNHGVFVNDLKPNSKFQIIPKTQGQVWTLEVIDNQLLCGHNSGTFSIENHSATLISTVTGGWVIKKLIKHPDLLIEGTYTHLCIYKKNKLGKWQFDHIVNGFSAPIRQLEEDSEGNIWVNKTSNSVSKLTLSPDSKRVSKLVEFNQTSIIENYKNLIKIKDKIILTGETNLLEYDSKSGQFKTSNILQAIQNQNINKIFPINQNLIFSIEKNGTLHFINEKNEVNNISFKRDLWVDDYENMRAIDPQNILLCTENGFAILPQNHHSILGKQIPIKTIIRGISVLDYPEKSKIINTNEFKEDFKLESYQNSIILSFATPQYSRQIQYSYWLENSTKGWSPWQNISQKEFNNLSAGKYIFHLKSSLNDSETTFSFEIKQPWYWNWWSKLFYFFLLVGIASFSLWMHNRKILIEQENLKRRHEKKLKRQIEQSEKTIIQIRNEQLEKDIIRKSEELANSTMSLIKKNELLVEIKKETDSLPHEIGNRSLREHRIYKKILHLVESNISTEQDWQIFEANFNEVHQEFLEKLLEKFPNLTPSDLKLAAYLRMNLSTKEIAQLFNITNRSVELKRYRLRKKLNLDTEVNLGEFMMKFRIMT
ncbi:two component regulator with propeller domain [Arcicella aurantiaca]|uniref:Two component regulator with propeller domain n=1 Tax=Arcicella aurantiaca TaxID=591202 RepID=A0A316EBL7_9BACT|nr:two-component regulator propeller domain-containing protein [Arcicella aurantiaca]PWK27074.1 two component regulator with propeller domain [Arcicella aurantiaca]